MSIKVGIISDTHGLLRPEVMEALQSCEYIIHAGDFAEERILDQIRFLGKLYVVRGNSDLWWADRLADTQQFHIGDLSFFLIHDRQKMGKPEEGTDVVIYGHTHRYSEETEDGTLWLNPGSCGISRFGEELSFVVMEIEGRSYRLNRIVIPAL